MELTLNTSSVALGTGAARLLARWRLPMTIFGILFTSQVLSGFVVLSSVASLAPIFTLTIQRNMSCLDQSTIGSVQIDGVEVGRSLELPWRNNEFNSSRIPAGRYDATMRSDGARGWRIELQQVTGAGGIERKNVQIHVGNYPEQTKGCILLGEDVARVGDKCSVTHSRNTLETARKRIAEFAGDDRMSRAVAIIVQINDE